MTEQVSEAAVLFADVSGSTKLYETAGDAVAHAAIEKCVNLMREKTVNAKGRVIKTIGDEVMSAFPTADAAADAAIEMVELEFQSYRLIDVITQTACWPALSSCSGKDRLHFRSIQVVVADKWPPCVPFSRQLRIVTERVKGPHHG